MKTKVIFAILLFSTSLFLSIFLTNRQNLDLNNVEIAKNLYLKCVDFFTEYHLLYEKGDSLTLISDNINELAIKDGKVIFSVKYSPNTLLGVNEKGEVHLLVDSYNVMKHELRPPMKIYNQFYSQSSNKILIQILLMTAIISGFWLLVLVFKWEKTKF